MNWILDKSKVLAEPSKDKDQKQVGNWRSDLGKEGIEMQIGELQEQRWSQKAEEWLIAPNKCVKERLLDG